MTTKEDRALHGKVRAANTRVGILESAVDILTRALVDGDIMSEVNALAVAADVMIHRQWPIEAEHAEWLSAR